MFLYLRPQFFEREIREAVLPKREAAPPAGTDAPTREATSAPEPQEAPPEPPLELPKLEASDAFVRSLAQTLSSHPKWTAWLAHESLVRRFVAAVDNVAEGKSPRKHVPFLAPEKPFAADARGETIVAAPESARRYDLVAEMVASLDTRGSVELFRQLRPLLDEAYRRLGYPEGDFEATLRRALRHLLETPIPSGPIELVPGVLTYEFRNPELEALSAAQKHLLRMGPANARKVQEKLRELLQALEAESASPQE